MHQGKPHLPQQFTFIHNMHIGKMFNYENVNSGLIY